MALLAVPGMTPELIKILGRWRSDAWKAYNHHTASFGLHFLRAAADTSVVATEALLDDRQDDDEE